MGTTRGAVRAAFPVLTSLAAPRGFEVDPDPMTITYGDDTYATAMTVRTSSTDSSMIPITGSAIRKAEDACPDANGAALLFGWVGEGGSIGIVALTQAQHERLVGIPAGLFTKTTRDNGETYYYANRAVPGSPEMADYARLEREKEILFLISLVKQ